MTEEEATALGKRLAACPGFRPMPGLKDMQSRTWDDSLLWRWHPSVDVPDLRQPASMGILLACVREAWEPRRGTDCIASSFHTGSKWGVGARVGSECFAVIVLPAYDTEAEALLVALEAAPQ
jgi:hypothetical protein